ncbi:hypothetical protein, partial [Aquiflexum sp.]|uniref:hypothetical protein n=1 Tax=Aquiflexum sp. TaxID=1872584 RepID=UPI0035940F8F
MIEIKPSTAFDVECKQCQSAQTAVHSLFFQGMHTLADASCQSCGFEFYQTLPIGHDLLFPMQIAKDGKYRFHDPRANGWLADSLVQSIKQPVSKSFQIEKKVNKSFDQVIIVNCLDTCFGHVFGKIWNTYTLLANKKDWGIIAIIPERCQWLLPKELAEVWSISIDLKDCDQTIGGLDEFIKTQLSRFEKISLSHTYTHLDHTKYIDFEKVLKRPRFDLKEFLILEPQFTFILREDRFWLNSHVLYYFFLASRKFKMERLFKPLFIWRQMHLVNKTGRKILKSLPHAHLKSSGLGNSGKLFSQIDDHRTDRILPETEMEWNEIYSRSHIVIGVHGSNMLIPT